MTITLCMILDALMTTHPEIEFNYYGSLPIRGIKLLPADSYTVQEDFLYVSQHGDNVQLQCGNAVTVQLSPPLPLEILFNELQDCYTNLRDWDMQMHLAILENKDSRYLLELSEQIIGNPVTLMDPSFKLIAKTKNIETHAHIFNHLCEHGYMPAELINNYIKQGFFNELANYHEAFSITSSSYISVIKSLMLDGQMVGYISMPCTSKYYTEGLSELFNCLAENILHCIRHDQQHANVHRFTYEYLLADLVDQPNVELVALRDRLKYIHLPESGEFTLLCFRRLQSNQLLTNYIAKRMYDYIPNEKIFLYRGDICVLLYSKAMPITSVEHTENIISTLCGFVKEQNMICGVSRVFRHLTEIRQAYIQTNQALNLGQSLEKKQALKKFGILKERNGVSIYRYESYVIYHLIAECAKHIPIQGLLCPQLLTLLEIDEKENTNHTQVLYYYLLHERGCGKTARVLYMHRNNVLYRIKRIEERLGISLDDPTTRSNLMLSYFVLEMMDDTE